MIFTGMSIALAGAFSSVVAAELMAASDGLGWMIFSASRFLRNDIIMLGIILLGLFGMALSRSLLRDRSARDPLARTRMTRLRGPWIATALRALLSCWAGGSR